MKRLDKTKATMQSMVFQNGAGIQNPNVRVSLSEVLPLCSLCSQVKGEESMKRSNMVPISPPHLINTIVIAVILLVSLIAIIVFHFETGDGSLSQFSLATSIKTNKGR